MLCWPSDDAVMGLWQMKEHAWSYRGVLKVDTSRKEVIAEMSDAHSLYTIRKQEEVSGARCNQQKKAEWGS